MGKSTVAERHNVLAVFVKPSRDRENRAVIPVLVIIVPPILKNRFRLPSSGFVLYEADPSFG